MIDIKKQHGNATITTTVHDVEYLESTIGNMVRYAKELKILQDTDYSDFEYDYVVEWFYHKTGGNDLTISEFGVFANYVENVGRDTYDAYNVSEYLYMFEETQNRILEGEE